MKLYLKTKWNQDPAIPLSRSGKVVYKWVCILSFSLGLYTASCIEAKAQSQAPSDTNSSGELREVISQNQNIATSKYGVILLPSSQDPSLDYEIEKACDQDATTSWHSAIGTLPNWIEAEWPQPVSVDKVVVNEEPSAHIRRFRVEAQINNTWQILVPEKENAQSPGQPIVEEFPRATIGKLRFYIVSMDGKPDEAVSKIKEVQVYGEAPEVLTLPLSRFSDSEILPSAFKIDNVKVFPRTASPNTWVQVEFTARITRNPPRDNGFFIRIGEKDDILFSDYSVARTFIWPQSKPEDWKPDKTYFIKTKVYLPDSSPEGSFGIFLTPVSESGAEAEGEPLASIDIRRPDWKDVAFPTELPRSEVRMEGGFPKLYVNGKSLPPFILTDIYPSYRVFGDYTKTGSHVWRLFVRKGLHSPYILQNKKEETNRYLEAVDRQISALLKVDPQAYILLTTDTEVSPEWTAAHPEDAVVLANGQKVSVSLSSPRWRQEMQEDLRTLVKHIAGQPYAGHFIGIIPWVAGETYYPGLDVNPFGTPREKTQIGDYNSYHLQAFRAWLREHYKGDVNHLKDAWKADVTFENATPDLKTLQREDLMFFRDPAKTRMPFDYWEFQSDVMADVCLEMGRAIKDASNGRLLVGVWGFYSNGFMAASGTPGKMQHSGAFGLEKVLNSPYIDFLSPLQAYSHVRWDTQMAPINVVDSIRQHKKLVMLEYDTRTFYTPVRYTERTYSQKETLSIINRDAMASTVKGDGLWWVGFSEGLQGRDSVPWFSEESLIKCLRKAWQIYQTAYMVPRKSISEVAVFVNNNDIYGSDIIMSPGLYSSIQYNPIYWEFPRTGAPFDQYLLSDINLPNMDQYKVYVILNAFTLSEEQRNQIKKVVERKGKTVVWLYAPGFNDGSKLSVENIRSLTGFNIGYDAVKMVPEMRILPGHNLTTDLPSDYSLKPTPYEHNPDKFEIGPIFYVDDPNSEPLGRYSYNQKVAFAHKTVSGGSAYYLAIPAINAELLREIYQSAGVHLYSSINTYLEVSDHFISVTNVGEKTSRKIALPGEEMIYDITDRAFVERDGTSFEAQIPAHSTKLYIFGEENLVSAFVKRLSDAESR